MFTCHGVLWSKLIIVSRQTEKFPLLFFDCQLSMDLLRSQPCKCAADAHDGGRLDVRLDFGPRSGRLSAHLSLNHHHHLSMSPPPPPETTASAHPSPHHHHHHHCQQQQQRPRISLSTTATTSEYLSLSLSLSLPTTTTSGNKKTTLAASVVTVRFRGIRSKGNRFSGIHSSRFKGFAQKAFA